MKHALVLGGAGFIGMALTRKLKAEGYWVRAVDLRFSPFAESAADDFTLLDLRRDLPAWLSHAPGGAKFDEVYQLACDMGGAGYIFTGEHDADVMANNVRINTNVATTFSKVGCGSLLYTSSSCVYNDEFAGHAVLTEAHADVNQPSNGYGWEKLFCEKLYEAHARNKGLNVSITRFSTIYGPGSAYDDGREKAVAAICRKVLDAPHGGEVEVWGDGQQVRPLVYIDDLLDAITGLARCKSFAGPVNIANDEMTTCDHVASRAIALSNKRLTIKHVPGPIGKQVLDMSTALAKQHLGWKAKTPFDVGIERTFEWIAAQKARRGVSVLA